MFMNVREEVSKKRKEVVTSIKDAAAQIKDGQTVAIGGFGADNHPMALVREIIRNGHEEPDRHRVRDRRPGDRSADRRRLREEADRALCRPGNVLPDRPQLPQVRRGRRDRGVGVQRVHPLRRLVRRGLGPGILRLARRRRHQHPRAQQGPRRVHRSDRQDQEDHRGAAAAGRLGASSMSAGRTPTATASISAPASATAGWRAPPTAS